MFRCHLALNKLGWEGGSQSTLGSEQDPGFHFYFSALVPRGKMSALCLGLVSFFLLVSIIHAFRRKTGGLLSPQGGRLWIQFSLCGHRVAMKVFAYKEQHGRLGWAWKAGMAVAGRHADTGLERPVSHQRTGKPFISSTGLRDLFKEVPVTHHPDFKWGS